MSENKDTDTLVWYANEPYVSWITYAQQLKYYLLKDSTKRVFVYGRENEKPVEYIRVTHGHWIPLNDQDAKCSLCGMVETTHGKDKTGQALIHKATKKFCPYCGNPLDEEEEDETD